MNPVLPQWAANILIVIAALGGSILIGILVGKVIKFFDRFDKGFGNDDMMQDDYNKDESFRC